MKLDSFDIKIPKGYKKYYNDIARAQFHICKWYLWPVFKTLKLIWSGKYCFYRYLYRKGVMHTEEGCTMCFKDLFKK